MFSAKATNAPDKLRSTFSAFMILHLLFTLIPPTVLATSSTRMGLMKGYREVPDDHTTSQMGLAYPALGAANLVNETNPLESGGEVDHNEYANPPVSDVREPGGVDAHVEPLFISEGGSVHNSVAVDEGEEPCVPVLIPATESV